jgi:signal transduction histidine kinase
MISTDQTSIHCENRKLIDSLSFSVSARVAMQLGRESISSSITAILELVKNAYDADAEWVRIRFATIRSHRFMIIEDKGDGMSPEALRDQWMVLGTADKVSNRRTSTKQRIKTGEKGLGRLGLDRLCTHTRVQSITDGAPQALELKVNWGKYELAGARLETIEHRLYSIPGLRRDPITREEEDYPKGTRLILMGLKDRWDEEQLGELHQELSFLLSPFGKSEDFTIELDTGGLAPSLDGSIEQPEELLEQAYWKVEATIDEASSVEILMSAPQRAPAFQQPKVPWKEFIKGYGDEPRCGPLSFSFYFFLRDEFDEARFTKARIAEFLRNNQGIRIYRDGFRVKPYGEPNGEGDWLRLAFERMRNPGGVKAKGPWRVGYNQVVGAVFLSREGNPELVDQTNREGLVLGDAFTDLVAFAQRVVHFFERYHQEFERKRSRAAGDQTDTKDDSKATSDAAASALTELSQLATRLGYLADGLQVIPPTEEPQVPTDSPSVAFAKINEALSSAVAKFEIEIRKKNEVIEQREKEKNTLSNLASLGILTACFGHETLGWANVVATNANLLRRNMDKSLFMVLPDAEAEVRRCLTVLHSESVKLETFAGFALGNVKPAKRRRTKFCVKKIAEEVLLIFDKTFQHEKHVKVESAPASIANCIIRAYRIDWESIFVNLIVNAVWAMRHKPIDERIIRIGFFDQTNSFRIVFEDSGFGLEAGTENQVFEAGFSTKRNTHGEQEGTGMGLFIVKSFVEENSGGTIQAFAKGDLGGARFVIQVPSVVDATKGK